MKYLFFSLAFLTIGFHGNAQNDETTIPIVAYWSKGDSYNYRVTKIRERWKDGSFVRKDSTTYDANFEVIEETEMNYKIRWTYQFDLSTLGLDESESDELEALTKTEVIYTTNELGEFLGIENWEAIAEKMRSIFDHTIEELAKGDEQKKETLATTIETIKDVYVSQEGIEQSVYNELQYLHALFGYEYDTNEPLESEIEYPNLFGGPALKGTTVMYFESIDEENAYCIFHQDSQLNPKDVNDFVKLVLKKTNLNNKELKKAMEEAQFEMSDKNTFELNYDTGVPVKIEIIRSALIDIDNQKGKTIDIIRIEQL